MSLYKHYKNNYDFKLSHMSYMELEEKINHQGELFSDDQKGVNMASSFRRNSKASR